jgi:thiol-disulfide isomerase/thioredoxin
MMKSKPLPTRYVLLGLLCGVLPSQGQAATLKVGDPAPKLQVSKWVQGEPVKKFDRDKAYIVEFWATWCGPCRVSIPHLNEIHTKFKDKGLIVIGQDCWERNEEAVEPFIKKMGDKMTYRVALDDKESSEKGKMAETWMEAAGQNGIPSAFVVDKQGMIAWIGHPMQLKEELLEQVLAGTFDLKKAAAAYEARQKNQEQLESSWRKFNTGLRKEQWSDAEAALAELEKLMPEEDRNQLSMMKFRLYLGKKEYAAAYKLARKLSDAEPDNPMLQNELAWAIATTKGVEERDLDLAETMARRANDATKGKDAAILDTLARVLFMKGEKEKAIELQQKAVDLAEGAFAKQLQKILDSYKAGKLPKGE